MYAYRSIAVSELKTAPPHRVRPEEGLKKRNRIPDFECIDSVSYHRNRIFKKVFPVPVRPEPEFGKPVPDPVIPDSEDKPDFRPDNIFLKSSLFSEFIINLDVKSYQTNWG